MDNLLSIGQAASLLGVSIDTLRRWDKAGRITSVRIDGKNRFFKKDELLRLKKENENLRVTEAAKEIGVSASTLRRYEQKGVITPERNEKGERVYRRDILEKLAGGEKPDSDNKRIGLFFSGKLALIVLIFMTMLSTLYLREVVIRNQGVILSTTRGLAEKAERTFLAVFIKERQATTKPITEQEIPINAYWLQDRVPGVEKGNIAYFSEDGQIAGLLLATDQEISEGDITSREILNGTIRAEDITNETITGLKILNDSIKNEDIADGAINSSKIGDESVTYSDIKDDTVSATELASNLFFTGGDLVDLSGITHITTSKQGLILPNVSSGSPLSPSGGEGYLAYDTSGNQVLVFNGSSWEQIGGAISLYTGTGITTTDSSASGLELINTNEISLLRGCDATNNILKWNDVTKVWECQQDVGGLGSGVSVIRESDLNPSVSSVSTLEFGPAGDSTVDFAVSNQGGGVARVVLGSNVAHINAAETVSGGWTFNTAPTTFATAIDVNTTSTMAGLTVDGGTLAVNTASGITSTQATLTINAGGTVDVDDILNANSITSDAGVSIAAGSSYTGAGAVTLSSANTFGLTLDSGSGAVSIATGDSIGNGTWSINSSGVGTSLSANDLSGCTNCIGAAEISDLTLGTDTVGDYVAGATTNGGLTMTGTEGGTLGISVQASKGLEVDGNGLSLVDCGNNQILKYSTGSNTWTCQSDETGGTAAATWTIEGTAVIRPANETLDMLLGSNATASAEIAFINIDDGATGNPMITSKEALTVQSGGTGALTLDSASGTVFVASGDSIGNGTWSINSSGVGTSLSANDLSGCTNCIGATEVDESGISSTGLSDGANIAHINAAETVTGGWTFNTAATTFTTGIAANGGITSTQATLTINAGGTVDVDDILNANSITSDAGVSIAAGSSYTGAGAVTLSSANTFGLTLDSGSGAVSIATGDSIGNGTWSINSSGVGTSLSANDLSGCTNCIGATEVDESGISSTGLSDGANIAHINAAETVTGGWTFNTAATTFTTAIDVNTTSTMAGLTVDGGALAVNTANGITSDQVTLIINAGGTVNVQDNLDTDGTITAGSGGEAITLVSGKIDADAITLASSGTTGLSTSRSGLQTSSDGLTLLMGCTDGQLMEWTDADGWTCADDNTSAGAGISTIQENDVNVDAAANTLDFLGADFAVTSNPAGEANVAIDYANSAITRNNVSETINNDWTYSLAETEDLAVNISISGSNSGQGEIITLTNSSTSGNQYGLYLDNAASTGTTDASLVIDNSDTDTAVTTGLQFVNAGGGFTTGIEITGATTDITTTNNENLTLAANGTGDIVLGADADTSINFGTTSFTSCSTLATDASGNVTCSGVGDTAAFEDSTPAAFNGDVDTVELFNDATKPNIVTNSTTSTVLVTVNVEGNLSNTANDFSPAARIVFTTDGTDPSCSGSSQVGIPMSSGFATAATQPWADLTGVFIHTPGAAATIKYTVCSSAAAEGTTFTDTATSITVGLVELGADLAENYPTDDPLIEPGDVVSVGTETVGVIKSIKAYDSRVMGVVSTVPALTFASVDGADETNHVPVALAGRIPVKVSTENGRVKAGDLLTSSSIPGMAMKATKAGPIIGQALHDFGYGDGETGLVAMIVKSGYYNGSKLEEILPLGSDQSNLGRLVLEYFLSQKDQLLTVTDISEMTTDRLAAGLEVVTPRVIADEVIARSIKAESIEGLEFITGRIAGLEIQVESLQNATTSAQVISTPTAVPESFDTLAVISKLNVGSGLSVSGTSEFGGLSIFNSQANFLGGIEFAKAPTFNNDTAGFAMIKKGAREVRVEFVQEYASAPIVNATPLWDANSETLDIARKFSEYILLPKQDYIVAGVTTKGFTIILEEAAVIDLKFNWMALAIRDAKTFESGLSEPAITPTNIPEITEVPTVMVTLTPVPTATPSANPLIELDGFSGAEATAGGSINP